MMFNNILTTILGAAHLAAMDAPPGGDVADAGPVDPPPDMPAHPAGWVRLTVVDDGPGMNDAILDHLFDRFFTTKQRVGPWGWRWSPG